MNRWAPDTIRRKMAPLPRRRPGRRYRGGVVTWIADRKASVRTDDDDILDVIVPNGLWPEVGNRVALARYPGVWVVAFLVRGPAGEGRRP